MCKFFIVSLSHVSFKCKRQLHTFKDVLDILTLCFNHQNFLPFLICEAIYDSMLCIYSSLCLWCPSHYVFLGNLYFFLGPVERLSPQPLWIHRERCSFCFLYFILLSPSPLSYYGSYFIFNYLFPCLSLPLDPWGKGWRFIYTLIAKPSPNLAHSLSPISTCWMYAIILGCRCRMWVIS